MMTSDQALPRVTYTNLQTDFTALHAHFDGVIAAAGVDLLERHRTSVIGGRSRNSGQPETIASPIDSRLILGTFDVASPALVDEAVQTARRASASWRVLGWERRIAILRAGARVLETRKYALSAACLIEVGKSRLEAIGEVEEAIDLIDYYCGEMERNDGFLITRNPAVPSESSTVVLRPYGVFGVIAPFNFPVALSLAMITAALVAGNTVVFKPGERSGLTGTLLVQCMLDGGLPEGVLNLVLGGRDTGQAMADHRGIDGFAFTGSNAVGMALLRGATSGRAARPVLAEMGGKNPAFVTAAADLEVAASGVMRSAFGLQGQKCSALSKVYVHNSVEDAFIEALLRATATARIGDPRHADTYMGPVIDERAVARFADAAATARRDGAILSGGDRLSGDLFDRGNYVAPTIAVGLDRDHSINREELFLPFLSVLPFDDLESAITDANRSDFGLTAGIYSKDPGELACFLDRIEAGVLYANRASGATTGAWPGIQTFCGWKGSGTSGKGGLGPWYLPQFMREQSRTIFGAAD